jgi:hypothetical protein
MRGGLTDLSRLCRGMGSMSQDMKEERVMGSHENPAPHHETPTFGQPDLPPEGMETTTGDPAGTKMTGPQNPVLEAQFPNVMNAPATDIVALHDRGCSRGLNPPVSRSDLAVGEVAEAEG